MSISVHPLYEGTFSVGLDKKFNPIAKDNPPGKGALKLSIRPFLIKTDDRNILFDVGIGDLFGADTSIQTMFENLEKFDLSNFDITDIFLSHLHFDHFAGLANTLNGFWELTFPNAVIWVNQNGWENLIDNLSKEEEKKQDLVSFLDAKADIHFLKENDYTIPNVRSETAGGHSKFHQILYFEHEKQNYLMAGDIIGKRIEINRSFAAKYDYQPKVSMQWREKLKKLAYKKNYHILAYHETDHPIFKLSEFDEKKGYTIQNLT